MRAERLGKPCAASEGADALVERAARQRLSAPGAEERRCGKLRTADLDVLAKIRGHLIVEGNRALVAALAAHGEGEGTKVDASLAQPRTLARANAGAIEQGDERTVTDADHGVEAAGLEYTRHFISIERCGELACGGLDPGKSGEGARLRLEVPHGDDRPVEAPEDRHRAVHRCGAVVALATQVLEVLEHLARGDGIGLAVAARFAPPPELPERRLVGRDRQRTQAPCHAVRAQIQCQPVTPLHDSNPLVWSFLLSCAENRTHKRPVERRSWGYPLPTPPPKSCPDHHSRV